MKSVNLALIGALGLAGTAFAQVPSTNDTSDVNANTGTGTSALGGPAATNGGGYNTASGYRALFVNTTGFGNAASGADTLYSNTTGNYNTASGYAALFENLTGGYNTGSGFQALAFNMTGSDNTAAGAYALFANSTGDSNTASGFKALYSNETGTRNAAAGAYALYNNTASDNSAMGYEALYSNTTGIWNNAVGSQALQTNTTGNNNNAVGFAVLLRNTTGSNNNAQGFEALLSNTTGSNNTAIGYQAGSRQTTGSNNIYIGNQGVAAESGQIRIGTSAQTDTYIAGIYGRSVSGSAVMVSSTGQLGVAVSSERFKTAIAPMGSETAKLAQLRPVTFHLKSDPKAALQYGLIAEEVAKVYPELVIRSESGRIDGVRYDELAPMLLNEAQRQHLTIAAQALEIRELKRQMTELKNFKQKLEAALSKLGANSNLLFQR